MSAAAPLLSSFRELWKSLPRLGRLMTEILLPDRHPATLSESCLPGALAQNRRSRPLCTSLGPTMSPVCLSLGSPFRLVFLLSLPPSLFLLLRVLLKSFVLLKRSWLQFASAFCGKSKQRKIKKAQSGLDGHSGWGTRISETPFTKEWA